MSDNKLVKSLLDAATITGLVAGIGWFVTLAGVGAGVGTGVGSSGIVSSGCEVMVSILRC